MSQYRKEQGDLEIIYGWDEPLKYYYLVVEEREGELPEALVWSNLNLTKPGLSLGELRVILEGFGCRLTDEEIGQLVQDVHPAIVEEPWGKGKSRQAT